MRVRVDQIVVGERRREDFGDIAGLAESIGKHGLLHPIVIDNDLRLVAGERRLRAIQHLGWREVDARPLGVLTEAERREIELEENLRRKDLTPYEQSRQMVIQAQRVADAIASKSGSEVCGPIISAKLAEKDPRGRKSEFGAAKRDVAEAIGTNESNLRRAEQHVAAVERYPELELAPQSTALRAAKAWDDLDEAEAAEIRAELKTVAERKGGADNLSIQDFVDAGVKVPDPPAAPPPEADAVSKVIRLTSLTRMDPSAVAEAEAEAYGSDAGELEVLADGVERVVEWGVRVVCELRKRASTPQLKVVR